ncbi:MAG: helix-turn-helix transcriptional regulator [Bacteroidetes bacterium]|nr:helix-turn-helix transcriptional regulator [Bacteroidota bacterium]MBS1933059.1 helix-turn-helix transcriptional regulator [Bacteroidota bacterium]
MRLYNTITEENKLSLNKPANSDMVYYSELNEWFTTNAFRSFSLKYVIDKCIHYKVGNKEYSVSSGSFMLACKQPHVKAFFDSRTVVKSICIDICPETVAEAFSIISQKEDYNFDNYQAKYFTYPEFFEAVCPAGTTSFAKKLDALVAAIKNGNTEELINKEWFFDLVEKIIYHEYGNYLALNGLHSVKLETRKELFNRLRAGKQFMDENFLTINEVTEISVASNLSEFHFFRSFKQAYGITPYQYLLNKRLELANELISTKNSSITDISLHCNFPDLFTFSKAYKRRYGISPSLARNT